MNCKNCGTQLVGNEITCPVCGALIDHTVTALPTDNVVNQPAVPIPETPIVPTTPAVPIPETPIVPTAPAVPIPETPIVPTTPVVPVPEAPVVQAAPVAPTPQTPVMQAAPVVPTPQTPVMQAAPVAPVPETPVAPVPEVSMSQYQMPSAMPNAVNQPQPEQQPVNKKRPVNVKFIIFMVIGIGLIAFSLYWTYVVQADPEEPEVPVTPETPVVSNDVTYNGYTFILPDSYKKDISDDYGMVVSNGENTYTIEIDYYNKYSAYVDKLKELYPDQVSTMTKKIGDREYSVINVKDATDAEANANLYYTKIDDDYTIVGIAVTKKFGNITDANYTDLNNILSSIGTIEDYDTSSSIFGKDGVKIFTFDKTKFSE